MWSELGSSSGCTAFRGCACLRPLFARSVFTARAPCRDNPTNLHHASRARDVAVAVGSIPGPEKPKKEKHRTSTSTQHVKAKTRQQHIRRQRTRDSEPTPNCEAHACNVRTNGHQRWRANTTAPCAEVSNVGAARTKLGICAILQHEENEFIAKTSLCSKAATTTADTHRTPDWR